MIKSDTEDSFKSDKIDISKTIARYYMLFLACFLCFGLYFIYDNPSALAPQLKAVHFT